MSTELAGSGGGWRPAEPLQIAPVFVWPPRPLQVLKVVLGYPGLIFPWTALYAAIAFATWRWLTPDASVVRTLHPAWIMEVFDRNLLLIVVVVGLWHFRLYVQRGQGLQYKYSARWPAKEAANFLFHSQLWDNVFWTLASAVPIWSAYEALTLWAQAKGLVPVIQWHTHPVYSTALMFIIIPVFHELHFYAIHRLIHIPVLYRAIHRLHHKNINPIPWSGLAMHPLEHLLYFSGVLLCWVLPSSALHVIFYLQYVALSPAPSHCGFDRIVVKGRTLLRLDFYDHYLHHKYFEVNYGGPLVPMDKWLGTWHDGSQEAQTAMRKRLRDRGSARKAGTAESTD
jgi:sterol desaturase/sphingolipid hydroxylase (fatty acid hydroxylase superfamily)